MSYTTVGPNDCDVQIKINCEGKSGKKYRKSKKDKVKCVNFNDVSLSYGLTGGLGVATDPIDQYLAAFGITVSLVAPVISAGAHTGDDRQLMVFNSAAPTGGDFDLGTPNNSLPVPGPGVGIGGELGAAGENRKARGNLLIVSEDNVSANPDDASAIELNANGGAGIAEVTFVFDSSVHLLYVDFIDSDAGVSANEKNPLVKVQDVSNVHLIGPTIGTTTDIGSGQAIIPIGNNSYQRFSVDETGVKKLTVCFQGSGAISEICFKKDDSCDHTINVCC